MPNRIRNNKVIAYLAVLAGLLSGTGPALATAAAVPSLINVFPSPAAPGSEITIIGAGFDTASNNVHFDFGGQKNIPSVDGTKISFIIPDFISGCAFWANPDDPCHLAATPVVPGFHQLSVSNSQGASNSIIFTVSKVLGTTTSSVQTLRLALQARTVYLVAAGERRGFPSPAVFFSQGYSFDQVAPATADDLALPEGPVLAYREGTLIKSAADPTVYIVSGDEKRAFTSKDVFTKLGYQFSSILTDAPETVGILPLGLPVASTNAAHPPGSLVNFSGTICKISPTGRVCVPSKETFASYGYDFKQVVPATADDLALPEVAVLEPRFPVVLEPSPRPASPASIIAPVAPLPPPTPPPTSTTTSIIIPPPSAPIGTITPSVTPAAPSSDSSLVSPPNDRTVPTLTFFAEISGFNDPAGVNVSPSGNIYVVDYHNDQVKVFDTNRTLVRTLGSTRGSADGFFSEPWDIAFDSLGNVLVSDTNNARIQVFNSSGKFVRKWNAGESYQGLAYVNDKTIYATGRKITVFNSEGTEAAALSLGDNYYPRNVSSDANGRIYYSNWGNVSGCCSFDSNNFFTIHSPSGALLKKVSLDYQPLFIDVDDKFRIWIVDHMHAKVKVYDSTGSYLTEFTFPGLVPASESIAGLEVHNNKLYISSQRTDKVYIYEINTSGAAPSVTVTPPSPTPSPTPTPSPAPTPTPTPPPAPSPAPAPSPSPSPTTATTTPSTSPSPTPTPTPTPTPSPAPSPAPSTLDPPTAVSAVLKAAQHVEITWSGTAANYKVYRCVADFGCGGAAAYTLIFASPYSYLHDVSVSAGLTYRYKIYSCDSGGSNCSTGTESNSVAVN